ncbi:coiled-coil domain-containing protein 191 [Anoplophora glabripennis]|uniref:coiled-coil domain-containing protein 191 n=1 Tax=Anoplophora glabripennis TaxID=217634 RepID=UPI0008735821|nr:coiled-coil domain-containing protein 191 [Anoplophora glabripennis]
MERIDTLQVNYEENNVLSKCENVFLEAKRVLLNEQLDKIANITLSEVNNSRKTIENCMKQCKHSLNWQNEKFWEELPPNPKNPKSKLKDVSNRCPINEEINTIIGDLVKINRNEHINLKPDGRDEYLTKKYFLLWKKTVKHKIEKKKLPRNTLDQKEKLERFFKRIKQHTKREKSCSKKETLCTNISQQKPPSPQIYENRYKAQKSIIIMQKAKLEEQNKVIEELKMGVIREDLLKSIENTKNNIREIFSNCSSKVKCKVPVVVIQETQQFKIRTQKAPKIVQQLEQRALLRAQKRQLVLETKRLIEEARQKMLEEAIENKRVMEEEERKRNLEIIKERRKKELEQEKVRQANKQKYLESLNKAINFYNKLTLAKCFKKLYKNCQTNKANALLAKEHYETKTLKRNIYRWCDFVEDTYKLKYEIADAHFTYTVLKKTLKIWHEVHIENKRNMQVAEDLYDFRLTSNTFIYWHRYVCSLFTLQSKQLKLAESRYRRRLLFHCFYLWRSLPAVIQLEKAKELKKRKWREKVWEVVPDYRPPEDI